MNKNRKHINVDDDVGDDNHNKRKLNNNNSNKNKKNPAKNESKKWIEQITTASAAATKLYQQNEYKKIPHNFYLRNIALFVYLFPSWICTFRPNVLKWMNGNKQKELDRKSEWFRVMMANQR